MQRTIFTTPGVNTVLRVLSTAFLRATGWTLDGQAPAGHPKCVLIAAPHTSNWDLPYTLLVAFALRLNIHWMGKRQIFRWPFGALMRWLGGIAVDRAQSTNLVAASAQALREAEGSVHLVVPPEGTRSQTRHWKTGFYWIAHEAGVPIVLAYMDYPRKLSGLGPVFTPTGDIAADMLQIKAYYSQYKGKNWRQFSTD
ncbi:lysophospholipid acyltransferase family protein [Pseudaquabacterium pictum]|uniref:Acyltransferase n=1 Tax=Pseudaquabacterium pictum TaxID=2315236 RepID=A0A480ARK2_9BURK|nr:lysophospholipid acyltransferase family protein [Rubrivivax pictus]GCL64194.1 acyltransferase [Rubrivivax pictus]